MGHTFSIGPTVLNGTFRNRSTIDSNDFALEKPLRVFLELLEGFPNIRLPINRQDLSEYRGHIGDVNQTCFYARPPEMICKAEVFR